MIQRGAYNCSFSIWILRYNHSTRWKTLPRIILELPVCMKLWLNGYLASLEVSSSYLAGLNECLPFHTSKRLANGWCFLCSCLPRQHSSKMLVITCQSLRFEFCFITAKLRPSAFNLDSHTLSKLIWQTPY